jgi:cation diffusion facilitator CzcD-associated flavoprotein CzcO
MAKARHKRVAIIGAGISGVVTAAHLKKEHIDVVVFERSKSAGGIWLAKYIIIIGRDCLIQS